MITLAKRGDLHARRQLVSKMPHEPLIVEKLMGELAPKYADRASGFTRIVKLGQRPGRRLDGPDRARPRTGARHTDTGPMTADAQRCARAVIEYDGTAFAGSQVQPNARTVQGELERRLTG